MLQAHSKQCKAKQSKVVPVMQAGCSRQYVCSGLLEANMQAQPTDWQTAAASAQLHVVHQLPYSQPPTQQQGFSRFRHALSPLQCSSMCPHALCCFAAWGMPQASLSERALSGKTHLLCQAPS